MFGRPIYDHTHSNLKPIQRLLERKKRYISRRRTEAYIETSHAFLKSYYDLAADYFDDSRFVHLIRNPLKTARSEANREQWIESIHFPLRHYRVANGQKLFNWSLTGDEEIYQNIGIEDPSLFQFYVIQWIEIENRAMTFLKDFDATDRCVTLQSPHELNDAASIQDAISRLGLELSGESIAVAGKQNRTPGARTEITSREEDEFHEVVSRIPQEYLEIFTLEPYAAQEWVRWLKK